MIVSHSIATHLTLEASAAIMVQFFVQCNFFDRPESSTMASDARSIANDYAVLDLRIYRQTRGSRIYAKPQTVQSSLDHDGV